MTAPSTSSTNDIAKPAYEVSTVSLNVNTASPQVSTASFSDNAVYAFMVENPNGSNLLQQDLEQIHEDDLEATDLKWQLSLLSMRAKRECRASRNKEGQFKNQDNTRKHGNNEDTYSKAMLAIDGVATYKRGLATVEEQLITYIKNEVLFSEEFAVLKREVACKDYEINVLKSDFEKVKQEKEVIEFMIEKFDKASKDLDKLLGSQITDKSKKGLGYNDVPPPYPLIYNRPKKLDLSYSGLDEFKEPEFKSYGSKEKQVSKDTSSFVESPLNVTIKGKGWPKAVNTARPHSAVVNVVRVNQTNAIKASACWGKPQQDDTGFIDSGCSRHMTRNIAYLSDFKEFDRGYVTFGGGAHWEKGIRREYSVARTPQQNGVAERRNRILIETAKPCLVTLSYLSQFGQKQLVLLAMYTGRTKCRSTKSAAGDPKQVEDGPDNENDEKDKFKDDSSPKEVNTARQHVNTTSPKVNTGRFKLNTVDPSVSTASSYDPDSPKDMFKMGASHTLKATHVEFFSDEDEPEVDLGNITNSYTAPTTPNTRIHKDHPITNVIGDVKSSIQIKRMTKSTSEQGFLSVIEPTSIAKALSDSSWVEAMQEELLIQTPTSLDTCGFAYREEGHWNKMVYQMDVKSAFLYRTIKEEVYVTQPPGFKDPNYPDKVYKVVKALYGLHQAPRAWYETLANYLLGNGFKRGKIDQTLFIKKKKGDILHVQVAVCSSLRLLKPKVHKSSLEPRRDQIINLIRTQCQNTLVEDGNPA
ncbi:putative ribonuclease H-like domain-containing protein [Tanacetum coccineum]